MMRAMDESQKKPDFAYVVLDEIPLERFADREPVVTPAMLTQFCFEHPFRARWLLWSLKLRWWMMSFKAP